MKLLTLTNRYYLISILPILVIGGCISYFILKGIINREFNEKLFAEKEQFIHEWHTYDKLRETLYLNVGDKIEVRAVDRDPKIVSVLSDTTMYDTFEKRQLPYRQLKFSDKLHGKYYIITITKSMLPTEELVRGVGEIILILIVGLVLSLWLVGRKISKKIWTPFNETISSLKNYQISSSTGVRFAQTAIDEFTELNSVLTQMINKSKSDYLNLKEFTENASHEIQTPLAIIKSKAELLLQEGNLSQSDMEDVGKIYEAANRLSRLKQGLSMLAKIENNQFGEVEAIDMATFIDKYLENLEELIEIKHLTVKKLFHGKPILIWNNTLAYVLINNLLNNAIKHNVEGGQITITLTSDELIIENTGRALGDDPVKLFQRFKRKGTVTDSSGLGLSLVKKICDIYSMAISYTIQGEIHRMALRF